MNRSRALSLACSLLLAAPLAWAQNPGAPGPPDYPRRSEMRGPEGGHGRGMGILPGGMWWKRPEVIKDLNITADQQKQLDKILLESRPQLLQMHANLRDEQVKLEPLLNANPFDQSRAFAQIAHIADLRAELEKMDARMLLNLRAVISADQWAKLQSERQFRQPGEGLEGQPPNWRRGPQGGSDTNGPPPPGQNNE